MPNINIHLPEDSDFRINEAYKSLRTNIEFCGSDVRAVAITSCTPNEGKSSVAFHLSVSMADANKKVLFIDADLRKSVFIGRYKINERVKGLSHYLAGQNEFPDVVCRTNIRGLHVVLAGPVPPNPAELLGGKRFKELLPSVRNVYDYVIIDTPPLGSVIDSAIVANECDGAALVLEARAISRKFAVRILEQMEKTDCRILGVILNKIDMGGKGYYGRYYGKYYGSYYGTYENH